jgi:hypothetical protein
VKGGGILAILCVTSFRKTTAPTNSCCWIGCGGINAIEADRSNFDDGSRSLPMYRKIHVRVISL